MATGRRGEGALATLAAFSLSIAWAHGCGIDLTNDLAGRPCKNQVCLPGYICSEANTCILDPGSGGNLGSGGSDPEGGTQGIGGSTEGTGGTEGTGPDPDASAGSGGSGGTSGGTGGAGGTAASGGTGGSGGTGDGGGSGGTGGATGSGGDGGNPWPGVGCLQLTCTPTQVCCVATYPGFPNPPPQPAAFRCAEPGATCAYTLRCDGDHDCPSGQECCVGQTAGGWVASCEASCEDPPYRVECTKPEHCATGLQCCAVWNFTVNHFDSVSCRPSCNGLNDRVMCSVENDCAGNPTCQASAVMPGFKTCQ